MRPRACPPCQAEQDRWLDTKPSTHVDPGVSFASHAEYDDTAAGIRDNRSARWLRWRDLVVSQRAAIADVCAREGHLDRADRPLEAVA